MKLRNDENTETTVNSKNKTENELNTKIYTINMETGNILNYQHNNEDEEINEKNEIKNSFGSENIEQSSTRLLHITKSENGACGFHLTRTKWDPYPWVSFVEENTPAEISGLKVGDCVLEVNGEDVLGMRITDIAKLVKANSKHVALLLWSAGSDAKFEPETLCDAPMPHTLQRLSIIVQSILSIIECPVCLDTISPPAMQCQNGHLLCVNCRIRADKCPICRDRYTPRRALIAEQIYAAITSAFNLCRSEDKLRQKLFGTNVKHSQQQDKQENMSDKNNNKMVTTSSEEKEIKSSSYCHVAAKVCKSLAKGNTVTLPMPATNKSLTKLLLGKACSMDNSSSTTTVQTQMETSETTAVTSNASWKLATTMSTSCSFSNVNPALNVMSGATNSSITTNEPARQSATNQLNNVTTISNTSNSHRNYLDDSLLLKNRNLQENAMSEHFSLSINGLLEQQMQQMSVSSNQLTTPALDALITLEKNENDEQTHTYNNADVVCKQKPTTNEFTNYTKRPSRNRFNSKISKCNNSNDLSITNNVDEISLSCSSPQKLSLL